MNTTHLSPSSVATNAGQCCRTVVSSIADAVTIADSPPRKLPSFPGSLDEPAARIPETTALLIDCSTSMKGSFEGAEDKLAAAKMGAATFVLEKHRHHPGDAVGVISFSSTPSLISDPLPVRSTRASLTSAILSLTANGGTNITKVLEAAEEMLLGNGACASPHIVLLTDGHGGNARKVAGRLKDAGVVIHAIGIGECPTDVDEDLLRDIASRVDGTLQYVFAKDRQSLLATYSECSITGSLT